MQAVGLVFAFTKLRCWYSEVTASCTRPPDSPGDMNIVTQFELFAVETPDLIYGPFISRASAKQKGFTRYYVGPCAKNHCVGRRVCDWKCPECGHLGNRIRNKRYHATHVEQMVAERKIKNSTSEYKKYHRQWMVKYREDPQQRFLSNLRSRLSIAVKKGKKAASTIELTGCTIAELRDYLQSQFLPGMTWENYGKHGWHVDHIRPCASFDLIDEKQQRECFHYANLQPLWAIDNFRKGARWQKH